jgi:hypothetical protein
MITIQTLRDNESALRAKFKPTETIAIPNASMSQFSIARYYGGINFNGQHFVYNPDDDSLIRADVLKWMKGHLKKAKKATT